MSPAGGEGWHPLPPAVAQKDSALLLLALPAALHCYYLLAPLPGLEAEEVQPQGCLYLKRCRRLDSRLSHLQLCDCGFGIHTRLAQLIDQLLAPQQLLAKILVVCKVGTRSLLASLSSTAFQLPRTLCTLQDMCVSLGGRETLRWLNWPSNQEAGWHSCTEGSLTCCQLWWQLRPLLDLWEIHLQALNLRQPIGGAQVPFNGSMLPVNSRLTCSSRSW